LVRIPLFLSWDLLFFLSLDDDFFFPAASMMVSACSRASCGGL
jgi:hypothetical protein